MPKVMKLLKNHLVTSMANILAKFEMAKVLKTRTKSMKHGNEANSHKNKHKRVVHLLILISDNTLEVLYLVITTCWLQFCTILHETKTFMFSVTNRTH